MAIKKPADQKAIRLDQSAQSAHSAFQPASVVSPFRTASELMKEDASHSENERRIKKWAELMIREKKLAPGWKEDRDATATVRWIGDRNAPLPEMADKGKKKSKARAEED